MTAGFKFHSACYRSPRNWSQSTFASCCKIDYCVSACQGGTRSRDFYGLYLRRKRWWRPKYARIHVLGKQWCPSRRFDTGIEISHQYFNIVLRIRISTHSVWSSANSYRQITLSINQPVCTVIATLSVSVPDHLGLLSNEDTFRYSGFAAVNGRVAYTNERMLLQEHFTHLQYIVNEHKGWHIKNR